MRTEPEIALPAELLSDALAIGNDLVELAGFRESCTALFRQNVYTEGEIAYCERFADSWLRYASTWAAKEAVYKALKQVDPAPLSWKDIEIRREKIAGKPTVTLHKHPGKFRVSLSLTHDGDYAWAVCILLGNK